MVWLKWQLFSGLIFNCVISISVFRFLETKPPIISKVSNTVLLQKEWSDPYFKENTLLNKEWRAREKVLCHENIEKTGSSPDRKRSRFHDVFAVIYSIDEFDNIESTDKIEKIGKFHPKEFSAVKFVSSVVFD